MILASAGIVLPMIAFALLLRRECGRPADWLFAIAAAAGLGTGASSLVWYGLLSMPFHLLRGPVLADAAVWSLLIIWFIARGRRDAAVPYRPSSATSSRMSKGLALAACLLVVAWATVIFTVLSHAMPHGSWDAWSMWNERARFFFRGYPLTWRNGFTPDLGAVHPEYPLMLSMTVARAWSYLGQEGTTAPVLFAALFSSAIVALAAASVTRAHGTVRGCLTAIAVLASPAFVRIAPIQYSDVPLGFFMLATFVCLDRAIERPARRMWWLLAGLSIGIAAWTKNEGTMFVVAAVVPIAVWAIRARASVPWSGLALVGAGALPVLAAVSAFKISVPHTNEIIAATSLRRVFAQFRNWTRMRAILHSVGFELWFGGATIVGSLPIVALFTAIVGIRRPRPIAAILAIATMAIMLAGYITIYATTPYNVGWHLKTSVDRLIVQLLPTLVWGAFMLARSPLSETSR